MTELGRLAPVDPRTVWMREDRDFTPWLLTNQDRLAEALGIEVELTQAEHRVGGFSLDLIGKDLTHNTVLIVENQLEGTDHTHLGQILTYAAGTDASTIVWIATRFRDEHRQALEWLNEMTSEDTRFFGIQIRVVKIGESSPAPLFELVAEPNDWQKQVRAGTASVRVGGKGEFYRQFWTRFVERVRTEHPDWTRANRSTTDNWFNLRSPIAGTSITPGFAAGSRLRNELYIDSGDGETNLELLERFIAVRTAVESAYGRPLEFEDLPGKRACRIAEYREGDVSTVDRHDEFIDWFFDAGVRLRRAIQSIDIDAGS